MNRNEVFSTVFAFLMLGSVPTAASAQSGYYRPAPVFMNPAAIYAPAAVMTPVQPVSPLRSGLVPPIDAGAAIQGYGYSGYAYPSFYAPTAEVVRPVVAYSVPVTSYRFPMTAGYTAPVAVVPIATRPVLVRPKFYVPGQPIRNAIRAVTP